MADELHIASMVVHCKPARLAVLTQELASYPGLVVHAVSADGKAIVTLEADSSDVISATVAQVQHLDGVLSASLVYQCVDDLASMNEEMPDAEA